MKEVALASTPDGGMAEAPGEVGERSGSVSTVEQLIAGHYTDERAFLRRLLQLRQTWVEANKQNRFEDGIKAVLTKVYPDKAHFIYELLQNAQDARATWVCFNLQPDNLTVTHNGTKIFDRRHVVGITSIGGSVKEHDVNQIGKFGIGFKAVFAYTTSPRIFSKDYQFEIRDLVCPYPLEMARATWTETETRFELPFDHPRKTREQAYRETADGLHALPDNVLLFLNHIDTIEWTINGQERERIARLVYDDEKHVQIERTHAKDDRRVNSHWLRLRPQKPVTVTITADDGMKDVIGDVAIAFALKFKDEQQTLFDQSRPIGEQMAIAPIDGQLAIFFPADKEKTDLKFHLHGPYASTVARDSIPYSAENQLLLAESARLLADSLPVIRDMGLLTTDFLGVLPNDKDNLNDFYRPLRRSVVERMHEQPLVPTIVRDHAPAKHLFEGSAAIRNVIGNDELPFFVLGRLETTQSGSACPQWAAGVMQSSRPDDFLHTLRVKEWGWTSLFDAIVLRAGPQAPDPAYAEQWFGERSDEWMQRFYVLLNDIPRQGSASPFGKLGGCKIVRLATGMHVTASRAYFPSDSGTSNLGLPVVHSSVLEGKNQDRVTDAKSFLQKVGVKEIGEREHISALLKTYYQKCDPVTQQVAEPRLRPSSDEHRTHIARFVGWWTKEMDASPFTGYRVFLADNHDHLAYLAPDTFYLDKPLKTTGLAPLFTLPDTQLPTRHALWSGYKKLEDKERFAAFAATLGVMSKLRIECRCIPWDHPDSLVFNRYKYYQWTKNGINQDFTIPHLSAYLEAQNRDISKLVWDTMRGAQPSVLEAAFRPNGQHDKVVRHSSLVYELNRHAWIPNTQGQFHKPADMARDMLPSDFPYDDENGWLSAIDFGEEAQRRREEEQRRIHEEALRQASRKYQAEQLGIPLAVADQLAALSADQRVVALEKIGRAIKNAARTAFPERTSANREGRAAKVARDAREAEEKLYEKILISVRTSNGTTTVDARTALRDLYTNDDGVMVCQICKQEMPFKLDNGLYYFEAVTCVRDTRKEYSQNYLALCPTCAAKYCYANGSSDVISSLILDAEGLDVPVALAGEETTIRFTQVHLDDLHQVLRCDAHEVEEVAAEA